MRKNQYSACKHIWNTVSDWPIGPWQVGPPQNLAKRGPFQKSPLFAAKVPFCKIREFFETVELLNNGHFISHLNPSVLVNFFKEMDSREWRYGWRRREHRCIKSKGPLYFCKKTVLEIPSKKIVEYRLCQMLEYYWDSRSKQSMQLSKISGTNFVNSSILEEANIELWQSKSLCVRIFIKSVNW